MILKYTYSYSYSILTIDAARRSYKKDKLWELIFHQKNQAVGARLKYTTTLFANDLTCEQGLYSTVLQMLGNINLAL